jgi:hypothetical protein
MSGNRANASARQKRAGGAEISNGPNIQKMQQQMQQQQQQAAPKMSISDAIGLITLRLGKMEQTVNYLQTSSPNTASDSNTMPTFDTSRLEALEQKVKVLETKSAIQVQAQPQQQQQVQHMPLAMLSNLVTNDKLNQELNKMKVERPVIKSNDEEIQKLRTELAEVKDLLMKLQSCSIETNNKLVNIIFSQTPEFCAEEEREEGDVDDGQQEFLSSHFNLSDFIQKAIVIEESESKLEDLQNDIIEINSD